MKFVNKLTHELINSTQENAGKKYVDKKALWREKNKPVAKEKTQTEE